ncbi:replicative DNA helicase [bacterium BMS3Bbin06]|nr:replicative DNA helicase [bacterium BMS3Abin08]GBE35181.1 replicative DNA helicase [bacterium BMS3Bbin06]HDO34915.1 replicative DNA helicase [Nitrospirota bacterium]HDY71870.1 replicative DNA helicase [Nitrospirota bacterium]
MAISTLDQTLDKLPPQNLEAEQSILGAILLDNEALLKALDVTTIEDFYRNSHRKIFTAMLELFDRNEAIDLITLTDHLKMRNQLDEIGGVSYLTTLVNTVPTSANIRHHCRIVREKALMRGLVTSVTQIATMVYEENLPADDLVDAAEKKIFEISDRRVKSAFAKLKDLIKDSFEMIEQLYDRKESITGVPSGFRDLDDLTTGFQNGDLIIIGGRPSMGKTAFALNIAQHVGVEMNEPVAIFSLEMSKRQLALRMLCSEAMIDSNSVRKGFIRKEDWHKLTSAAGKLAEAPVYIDDSSNISVLEMRAKARRLKMEHGLSLVIVDYLQLMRGKSAFERREQEISDISRSLKALAKELELPVIALSQLNRGVEQRTDKRPSLADLRESGALEQDADVIVFLYRDEVYNRKSPDNKGMAEIIIAKQRNGPTATVNLAFISSCTRFTDYTDRAYDVEEEVF